MFAKSIVLAFGAALAAPALGAEITQNLTVYKAGTFFDASQTFPVISMTPAEFALFNPALGDLKRVMIDVTSEWSITQTFDGSFTNPAPAPYSLTATVTGLSPVYVGRSAGFGGHELALAYSGQKTVEGVGAISFPQNFGVGFTGQSETSCGFNVQPMTLACGSNAEYLKVGFFGLPGEKGVISSFANPKLTLSGTFPPGILGARAYFNETINVRLTYIYAPVPEPATWAMMIGGFGFIGAVTRRRMNTAVQVA